MKMTKKGREMTKSNNIRIMLLIAVCIALPLMLWGCPCPVEATGVRIVPQDSTTLEYDLIGGGPTLIFHAFKIYDWNVSDKLYEEPMDWYSTNTDVGYMIGNRFRATGHGTTEVYAIAYELLDLESNHVTVTVVAPED